MAINWVFLSIGLLYLIPVIALFRYFAIIKNREYLITAIIFLLLMLNGIIIGISGFGNIIERVTVLPAILLLFVITKRVLGKTYDRLYYSFFTISCGLAMFSIIVIETTDVKLEIYRIISFEIIRFLLGFYLVFAYSKVDLVLNTNRTKIVTNIWQLAGTVALVTALVRILDIILYLVKTPSDQLLAYSPELNASLVIISTGALVLSILTGITAVLFPELFLLSRFQINNVYRLYQIAEKMNKEDEFQILPHSSLMDYILAIKDMKEMEESTSFDSTES